MPTIHDRIKDRREELGLSMEALAAKCGVQWQTVQQWENGSTAPARSRHKKVAAALGMSVKWLLTGEDGPARMRAGELIQALADMLAGANADTRETIAGLLARLARDPSKAWAISQQVQILLSTSRSTQRAQQGGDRPIPAIDVVFDQGGAASSEDPSHTEER